MIRDSQNIPPAAIADPAISSGRAPIRGTSWALTPAITMMIPTIGRKAMPDFRALYPQTVCTKMVRKKNIPNIAVPMHSMIRLAADRFRLRKIRNGISACGLRDSMKTNDASSTTAAVSEPMTLVSPQCETPFGVVAALVRP